MRRASLVVLGLILFSSQTAISGGLTATHAAIALTQGSIGVLSGHPTDSFIPVVMLNHPYPADAPKDLEPDISTGLYIEGCVLTHSHNYTKDRPPEVYFGMKPQIGVPYSKTYDDDVVRIGDGTNPADDLMVIRTNRPPPEGYSMPRTVLAQKRIPIVKAEDFTDKKFQKYGHIFGYGYQGTDSVVDLKDPNQSYRKNQEQGVKQRGTAIPLGYGPATDPGGAMGRETTAKGDVLYLQRGPSIGTFGDSGAPFVYEGEIQGFQSTVSGIPLPTLPFLKEAARPARPFADEVIGNRYTSVPDNYEKIIQALDKLGCANNSPAKLQADAAAIVEKHIGKDGVMDWDNLKGEDRDQFEAIMAKFADQPKGTKMVLSTLASKEPGHFTVGIRSPKTPADTQPFPIDLGALKNVPVIKTVAPVLKAKATIQVPTPKVTEPDEYDNDN